ncbi:hypothetical protein ACF1AX_37460 [Streptomyces sp. NPDC014802]|uniref:hypothetical protein n=1 Tax=Streptomyces sp. NPDC014802 TaxID=3364917 RepID=UPI0037025A09
MLPDSDDLLPATLRALPPPWSDPAPERGRALEQLPHTEGNEQAALDALVAALPATPPDTSPNPDPLTHWAGDVLRWLEQDPHDQVRVADVAERCIGHGLAVHHAVDLLGSLGTPHGETALLRVVRRAGASEEARDTLRLLRARRYDVRTQQPPHGEEPLLPGLARDLPYSWPSGFQWPQDLPETDENLARARALLQACAPTGPLPDPAPGPEWEGTEDDEPPAWLEIRAVLRSLMPYARLVTRERLTEGMRECALLGIPGVPQDPDSEDAERFVQRWAAWITGWIAGEVFTWLGMYVDDEAAITPGTTALAEQYAHNGMAAEQAVSMLLWWKTLPHSREALTRLAADGSLPAHLRELAANGLDED